MKKSILVSLIAIMFCSTLLISGEKDPNSPTVLPVMTKEPEENKIYPIVIIGSGAAGTMAVKRAILNNTEVLLFAGAKQERKRSRGNWVRTVDNVPGLEKYTRTILELRNEVLSEIVNSPFKQHLILVEESVQTIESEDGNFKLMDGAGHTYHARYVILATGMMDEQPNIQGSIRPILTYANGQTVAYCLLCDGHRSLGKKTVVIGFSEDAANGALFLESKYQLNDIALLTNGHKPQITEETLKRLQEKRIAVRETPILEVLGDKETKRLSGFKLEDGSTVDAEMGYVMLGVRPNNQLALQLGAKVDARGLIITDANGETSVPNLFVAGDLRANSMKQIYTAWQHAVDCAQVINKRIRQFN
jgi:thioredoxin reductase (NADPH)